MSFLFCSLSYLCFIPAHLFIYICNVESATGAIVYKVTGILSYIPNKTQKNHEKKHLFKTSESFSNGNNDGSNAVCSQHSWTGRPVCSAAIKSKKD